MNEKPLGKITAILADLGLEVTYAYDDLVFVQHSAFLIQFSETDKELKLFINDECDQTEGDAAAEEITSAFQKESYNLILCGRYTLAPSDDETIKLEFI